MRHLATIEFIRGWLSFEVVRPQANYLYAHRGDGVRAMSHFADGGFMNFQELVPAGPDQMFVVLIPPILQLLIRGEFPSKQQRQFLADLLGAWAFPFVGVD